MTDSPAVLHVGGFVHADGQLDLQVGVLAVLGNGHPVELGLLWAAAGWTEDHLRGSGQLRTAATFTARRGRSRPVQKQQLLETAASPIRQPDKKKCKPKTFWFRWGANRGQQQRLMGLDRVWFCSPGPAPCPPEPGPRCSR